MFKTVGYAHSDKTVKFINMKGDEKKETKGKDEPDANKWPWPEASKWGNSLSATKLIFTLILFIDFYSSIFYPSNILINQILIFD